MKKNEKKIVATLNYLTALLFMVAGAISRNFVFVSLGCVYIALGSAAAKKARTSNEVASKNKENKNKNNR